MVLAPAKSTAASDAVLALSSLWGFYQLSGSGMPSAADTAEKAQQTMQGAPSTFIFAQTWFFLSFIASLVGIFRFSRRELFERLTPIHEMLSWLALVVGLPCLVGQFYYNVHSTLLANLHLLSILPAILSWLGGNRAGKNRVTRLLALAGDLSLGLFSIFHGNLWSFLASVLMAVSSWMVGNQAPNKMGLPPVDWFHYGMSAANCLLVAALGKSPLPLVGNMPMRSMFG